MKSFIFTLSLAFILFLTSFSQSTFAFFFCPFCSAPAPTLNEQLDLSDAVVVAEFIKAEKPMEGEQGIGSTTYAIKEILRTPPGKKLEVKQAITLEGFREGKPGDQVIITGTDGTLIAWGSPQAISEAGLKYLKDSPRKDIDEVIRLKYFVNYLDSKDSLISDDAYSEFAVAPFETVAKISDILPREKIHEWVFSPENQKGNVRLGFYGLLMGLCGNEQDKKDLEQYCTLDTTDYRLGIDGCMAGYLYLSGEEGLKKLEATKLTAKTASGNPIQLNEVYATLSAIRFMHDYGGDKIPKSRLAQSMRILLSHENLADLAIADLARWKDWDTSDQLIKLYAQTPDTDRRLKRSIAGFFVVCEADKPKDATTDPPHVTKAKNFLAQIEKTEPKIVEYARKVNEE